MTDVLFSAGGALTINEMKIIATEIDTGVHRRWCEDVYIGMGGERECTAWLETLPAEHKEN